MPDAPLRMTEGRLTTDSQGEEGRGERTMRWPCQVVPLGEVARAMASTGWDALSERQLLYSR